MLAKNNKYIEIFENYYSLVFASFRSKIDNIDDAQDLTQDLFIEVYRKLDSIESPRQWILGAIRYKLKEYYKRKKNDKQIDIDMALNDVSLTYINGFRDTRILLQHVLDDDSNYKDERERAIFDLVVFNKYTYKEVALQLGMTRRQVDYRMKLIVKRIMRKLKEKGIHNIEELL